MRNQKTVQIMVLLAVLGLTVSCGGGNDVPSVRNMEDFSYMGRRGVPYGPTATGQSLDLAVFEGKYVWVDYSAPWCGPCVSQAPTIQRLEHAYGDEVVFLTVLVSDSSPRIPATRTTARTWASKYGLEEAHVTAGHESVGYIPTHVLFSPMGQTLFRDSGVFSEAQIRSTIQTQMRGYDSWYDDNKDNLSVMLREMGELSR